MQMHQIPDLDSFNPFRPLLDLEKPSTHRVSLELDFSFSCRRERIDSEDFGLPAPPQLKAEPDFLNQEAVNPRERNSSPEPQSQTQPGPREKCKPVFALTTDPYLVGLEVGSLALHVKSFQPAGARAAALTKDGRPEVLQADRARGGPRVDQLAQPARLSFLQRP